MAYDPPKCIRYVCQRCQLTTHEKSNMNRHVRSAKCQGASITKEAFYVLAYTQDPALAVSAMAPENSGWQFRAGLNAAPAATAAAAPPSVAHTSTNTHGQNTHASTVHGNVNNTININVTIPPLPARSRQEHNAILKLFTENKQLLEEGVDEHDIPGFLAYVFEQAKIQGPPELQNMFVKGNDVYETCEGGTTRTPLGKCLNVWNHLILCAATDILASADAAEMDEDLAHAAQVYCDALCKPLCQTEKLEQVAVDGLAEKGPKEPLSVKEAAKLLSQDAAQFNKLSATLKNNVRECRAKLADKMEQLRKRKAPAS